MVTVAAHQSTGANQLNMHNFWSPSTTNQSYVDDDAFHKTASHNTIAS
jgi:hypothetical protein